MKFKPLPLYADCSKNLIKNPSKSLTIFPQCSDFDFLNLPEFSNLTNFHFNNIAGKLNKYAHLKSSSGAIGMYVATFPAISELANFRPYLAFF